MNYDQKIGHRAILLVEDDHTTRNVVARLLRRQGFVVREAAEGRLAMRMMTPEVRIALVDIGLPDFDGFEVVRRLRQRYAKNRLGICYFTSEKTREAVAQGLAVGGDDFIVKPLDPSLLLHKISRLLQSDEKHFVEVTADLPAVLHDNPIQPDLTIVRLSEAGIVLNSSARAQEGALLSISSDALTQCADGGILKIDLVVRNCREGLEGNYFLSGELVGLSPAMQQSLRSLAVRGRHVAWTKDEEPARLRAVSGGDS